jgi:hypothetical protein
MADLIGLDAVIYRGAVNTTPSTLMVNYRKAKLNRDKVMADNSRHGMKTASQRPTRTNNTIEFEMVDSDTDADVAALWAAFNADTPLAFKILDKANGKGILGDFYVSKMEQDQDEENMQIFSVGLSPTSEYRDVVAV